MARGDHLAADRGTYFHHAIDLGDGRVIHYRGTLGEKSDATVRIDPIEHFAAGCETFVVQYGTCDDPDKVIERAYSRLNERDYSLFGNNCEHFARWCKTGVASSEQVASRVAQAVVTASTIASGPTALPLLLAPLGLGSAALALLGVTPIGAAALAVAGVASVLRGDKPSGSSRIVTSELTREDLLREYPAGLEAEGPQPFRLRPRQ